MISLENANPGGRIAAWAYGCYAWILFSLILLCCGGIISVLHCARAGRRIARIGASLLFRLAGMPLSVKGLDRLPAGPHVLLVNHSSFLDGIVLTSLLPPDPGYAFVVRREFESQRLLWPLLSGIGTVFLRPRDDVSHAANVDMLTAALRRGENLVIFPEGGFAPQPGLKPFHSGAFVAAANAGVPIAIAGLRGARRALRSKAWLPRRAAIILEIGPVLIPTDASRAAIAQLKKNAHDAMARLAGENRL